MFSKTHLEKQLNEDNVQIFFMYAKLIQPEFSLNL